MHNLKTVAITREGFEYQDCLAMQFLIEMFIDPKLYEWVQIDSEDKEFKHVEDIVAKRASDGRYVCRQVKFRVEPSREDLKLSFEWLTEVEGKTPRSKSLLQKWAVRVLPMLQDDKIYDAKLMTNAEPDAAVKSVLNYKGCIEFDKIPDVYRKIIVSQIGSESSAKLFLEFFQFEHSLPESREKLARQLRGRLIPNYTTDVGWLTLQDQVKTWAMQKNSPDPDGCINPLRFQEQVYTLITSVIEG